MNRNTLILLLLAFILLYELLVSAGEALGQMRISYPKQFSFSGLIELRYKDYNIETHNGHTNSSKFSVFKHLYNLGVKGYIYHPKLAVFSARITLTDEKMIKTTSALKPESRSIIYELQTIFLPYRPVSLTTYATVSDFTFQGLNGNPYDNRITNFGTLLGINLRNLPAIRLEYYYLNVTPTGSQVYKGETTNHSYYLNVRGTSSPLRTLYSMNIGFSNIRNPYFERNNLFLDVYEKTSFKYFSVINFFRYYDQEISKLFGFYSSLEFKRDGRFFHDYYYRYENSKITFIDKTRKTDRQEIRASYSYKITRNLFSSLSLTYGLIEENIEDGKYHALAASINYSKPIRQHYFISFYRFFLRDNEFTGKYTEHSGSIEVTSKRYKWGRAYLSYNISILDGTFKISEGSEFDEFNVMEEEPQEGKFKATTHHLVFALRGKAFRKANWSIESQYIHSNATKERPRSFFEDSGGFFESDILKTERKRNYYLVLGDIFYPLGRRGASLNFRAGYSLGKIDSVETSKLFYEARFNLPLSRRLVLSSWWREAFYEIAGNPDRKTREYQILANYSRGRIFLSAEYWVLVNKEGSRTREDARFILKAKRSF